jgi:flagellar motor switch protein FliN/FliY
LASDLSKIIKSEISNTLEQLLGKKPDIDSVEPLGDEFGDDQCVKVEVNFSFDTAGDSVWKFYIPTITGTKFEYFMLGGMGELKEHIDEEIADATNEIVSNICGSIVTVVNAQNFDDVGQSSSETVSNEIMDCSGCGNEAYKFNLNFDGDVLPVILEFDDKVLPFISEITGKVVEVPSAHASAHSSGEDSGLLSLLGEDSVENLKLLFDIKLKLSVRLGTKILLLKDILRWDIGEIIELEQMVNEPLDVLVNGVKIGEGEAVIVEGRFGLKIKKIGTKAKRLYQASRV